MIFCMVVKMKSDILRHVYVAYQIRKVSLVYQTVLPLYGSLYVYPLECIVGIIPRGCLRERIC